MAELALKQNPDVALARLDEEKSRQGVRLAHGPFTPRVTAGSGLAYLLYYNLLAHVSATHVAAVTYLLPIWGLFWGLLAHESIGWSAYMGVAVVVSGLLLLNWQAKSRSVSATVKS